MSTCTVVREGLPEICTKPGFAGSHVTTENSLPVRESRKYKHLFLLYPDWWHLRNVCHCFPKVERTSFTPKSVYCTDSPTKSKHSKTEAVLNLNERAEWNRASVWWGRVLQICFCLHDTDVSPLRHTRKYYGRCLALYLACCTQIQHGSCVSVVIQQNSCVPVFPVLFFHSPNFPKRYKGRILLIEAIALLLLEDGGR